MSLLRAMLPGIAAIKFLPVPGVAHRPWLLGWKGLPFLFAAGVLPGDGDAGLFLAQLADRFTCRFDRRVYPFDPDPDARLLGPVVLETIPAHLAGPAALAGLLLESSFESIFSDPLVPVMLLVWMAAAVKRCHGHNLRGLRPRDLCLPELCAYQPCAHGSRWKEALAQAVSILPGLSRSGSAGMVAGLKQVFAARLVGVQHTWGFLRLRRQGIGFAGTNTVCGRSCLLVALLS